MVRDLSSLASVPRRNNYTCWRGTSFFTEQTLTNLLESSSAKVGSLGMAQDVSETPETQSWLLSSLGPGGVPSLSDQAFNISKAGEGMWALFDEDLNNRRILVQEEERLAILLCLKTKFGRCSIGFVTETVNFMSALLVGTCKLVQLNLVILLFNSKVWIAELKAKIFHQPPNISDSTNIFPLFRFWRKARSRSIPIRQRQIRGPRSYISVDPVNK